MIGHRIAQADAMQTFNADTPHAVPRGKAPAAAGAKAIGGVVLLTGELRALEKDLDAAGVLWTPGRGIGGVD